jgi:hypothetical protein
MRMSASMCLILMEMTGEHVEGPLMGTSALQASSLLHQHTMQDVQPCLVASKERWHGRLDNLIAGCQNTTGAVC